ncbi:MAG: YidC/Oxa1 family membrane protein insertase [Clostridia bacterium]|nr:YidC/Oxa1 family membrane protein insertase [Clostridia bacterium]
MYILAEPLAYIIRPIYNLIQNYGLTLIIVTIIIRIISIPLTIMSQKSTAKTQLLQPEILKLQQKYKNDKEKLSIEMQKLYTKHGVNPMGGCFPLIVQMFVLFGFIRVVYDPLRYILQLSVDQINAIREAVGASATTYQVTLCGMEGVKEQIIALGKTPINFDFMGIDLTQMLKGNVGNIHMWIFPVLAVLVTILNSIYSKKQMEKSGQGNEQAASMTNSMMMIMPVMTAYFTYIMPAGMSLYWFISTAVQLVQQVIINKIVKKELE